MRHRFTARDFTGLIGMEGFSEEMLHEHFKLYAGYVDNANKLLEVLDNKTKEAKAPDFAEVKRRLGFELNGIRLHELYFENLGGDSRLEAAQILATPLREAFGTPDAWLQDFKATCMLRGTGWCVLYHDPWTGSMANTWIDEHQNGHPAGWTPLLVLDAWEHAFMLDYHQDRAAYVEAFLQNVNWPTVEFRLTETIRAERGVHI